MTYKSLITGYVGEECEDEIIDCTTQGCDPGERLLTRTSHKLVISEKPHHIRNKFTVF